LSIHSIHRSIAGLILLLLLGLVGCHRTEESATGRDYPMRGRIVQLPTPENPAGELQIHHQAVPGFVDRSGQTTGMDAMTMGFPVAREISLSDLAVGDVVEFTLHVDWDGDLPIQITRLRRLPPATHP
jgi:hypothetical protein